MDGRAEAPQFCDGPPRRRCDDDILHLTWRIRMENLAHNRLDTSCRDAIKVHCLKDSLAPFVGDQLVHVAILVGLAYYFPRAAEASWWVTSLGAEKVKWYSAVLSCVAGVVLCVPASPMKFVATKLEG